MSRHIKTVALAGQQEEADAQVRSTVEIRCYHPV
jgi:hypothetical protein